MCSVRLDHKYNGGHLTQYCTSTEVGIDHGVGEYPYWAVLLQTCSTLTYLKVLRLGLNAMLPDYYIVGVGPCCQMAT